MGRRVCRESDIPSDALEAIHVYIIRVLNTVYTDAGDRRFSESSMNLKRKQDVTARKS